MRYIAVFCHFLTEEHRCRIRQAAAELGFTADFYERSSQVPQELLERYEVIYGAIAPKRVRTFPRLRWLCLDSAGADRFVDESIYPSPDVILSNSSGAYGITISEHILMVSLMLLRQMPAFTRAAEEKRWQSALPVRSLYGSRVTVLGTGDIGTAFARRVKALGAASVTGVRRSAAPADPAFDRVLTVDRLAEALPDTDLLVCALPHTAETAGLLSREMLSLLPPRAIVVNVGRGTLIDQEALAEALRQGRLAGAALDVMAPEPLPEDHFLWDVPNLIITPHVSGNMSLLKTCDLDVELFCADLKRFAAGQSPERTVDRARGY